jgi:hypothetical protein
MPNRVTDDRIELAEEELAHVLKRVNGMTRGTAIFVSSNDPRGQANRTATIASLQGQAAELVLLINDLQASRL